MVYGCKMTEGGAMRWEFYKYHTLDTYGATGLLSISSFDVYAESPYRGDEMHFYERDAQRTPTLPDRSRTPLLPFFGRGSTERANGTLVPESRFVLDTFA